MAGNGLGIGEVAEPLAKLKKQKLKLWTKV